MQRTLAPVVFFLVFASVVTIGSIGGSAVRVAAHDVVPETRTSKPKLVITPRNLNLGKKVGEAATGQFTMSAENGTFTVAVSAPVGNGAAAFHLTSGTGSFTLDPAGTAAVNVLFEPLSKGNFRAVVPITYSYQVTTKRGSKSINRTVKVKLHGSAAGPVPTPTATPTTTPTPTPTPGAFEGHVDGGSQAASDSIIGATVTLYSMGSSGYGAGVAALSSVSSDGGGNFIFAAGSFTCPESNPQTYIVATGGRASSVVSGSNSAIGMLALSGPCNSFVNSTYITVNPLTTVAAEWALAQFTDSTGTQIGTSATNSTGLGNSIALTMVNLVDSGSGNPTSFLASISSTCSNDPVVNCDGLEKMDTLANILSACIESSGPSSSPCYALFDNSGASTTTLQAAHVIAANPGTDVGALFAIQSGSAPFIPSEIAAPNSWTLALNYTAVSLNVPLGIAIDARGNVWVGNCGSAPICANGSGPSNLTEFNFLGSALSPINGDTGGGLNAPSAIAVDISGNVWAANESGNSLSEFVPSEGVFSPASPLTGGRLSKPAGIAIDASGNVWVSNVDGNSLSEFNPAIGAFTISGAKGPGVSAPLGVAIDSSGKVWIADCGTDCGGAVSSNLTAYNPATGSFLGSAFSGGGLAGPYGIAIDLSGNIWAANGSSGITGGLSEFLTSTGTFAAGSPYSGGGMDEPLNVATDGSGDVWVSNLNEVGLSEFDPVGNALSPSSGYTGGGLNDPWGVAIDASGNVWASNLGHYLYGGGDTLTEIIGVARPVLTPIVACLKRTPPSTVCLP